MKEDRKAVWSWVFYDWANSAFAVTVLAGFFPVFFKQYWCFETEPTQSTLRLGIGSTIAGLLIAVLSLLMGAIADSGRYKKRFLALFMLLGTSSTTALYFIGKGNWMAALVVFIIGNIGFSCSDLFYNSLLIDVADKKRMDIISSLGFSFGYLGCGILFTINVAMTIWPQSFGLIDEIHAVRVSFLTVALWWLLFSIPAFLFIKERFHGKKTAAASLTVQTLSNLKKTAGAIGRSRVLLFFIIAYWLYIDGLNTFIRMAIDFGLSIGFSSRTLMLALLLVQFVAFPSALAFGYLAGRFGAHVMILCGIFIYIAVTGGGAVFLRTETHFIVLALFTALAQGGIQALSRSYFGKLIPPENSSEYFGFYNVVGRFAVAGPSIVGLVAMLSHSAGLSSNLASRLGMSSVALLFGSGAFMLLKAEREREKQSKETQPLREEAVRESAIL